MTTYTVHVPDNVADYLARADRTVFVKDRFSLWGFLLGPLFLLRHRLWFALTAWLVVSAIIITVALKLQVPPGSLLVLSLLMHVFAGVEGNDLRRWGLQRRGFRLVDVVSGLTRDDAERAFFQRQPDLLHPASAVPSATAAGRLSAPASEVIGMFPDGVAS